MDDLKAGRPSAIDLLKQGVKHSKPQRAMTADGPTPPLEKLKNDVSINALIKWFDHISNIVELFERVRAKALTAMAPPPPVVDAEAELAAGALQLASAAVGAGSAAATAALGRTSMMPKALAKLPLANAANAMQSLVKKGEAAATNVIVKEQEKQMKRKESEVKGRIPGIAPIAGERKKRGKEKPVEVELTEAVREFTERFLSTANFKLISSLLQTVAGYPSGLFDLMLLSGASKAFVTKFSELWEQDLERV
jgi:hypothetical protein